ncbi:hypothetical protein FPHYL_13559 [Fusarium phyllophilum]|uniref:Uncharacterized protein n=1 Tax=Fusarium phyllophilum TaxID=47803 RepID=A0A8H5MMR5_9HYPO|nr:hypothetical protein FPHYL_13559 [Fusarium phyllophilum]
MTLGLDNAPNHHLQHEEQDPMPDHIDVDLLDHIGSEPSEKRLIIAVDFGTTYSSVSYVEIPEGCPSDIVDPRSICSIRNYPETLDFNVKDNMLMEVPSEVIYPLNRHFRELDSLIRSQDGLETASSDSEEQETHHDAPNNGVQDFDMHDDDGDTTMNIDTADQFHWGYKVHELWALPATHSDPSNLPLSRFKLLLDDSPMTKRVRQDLNSTLSTLKSRKVVHGPLHVIADYLTYLLDHTQSQLQQLGYEDSCPKEIVLCVPAIWNQQACRDMQKCLAVAMKRADLRGIDVQNNSIENLFIVSEPEAAAAHMLAYSTQIRILGGGTVDANTYRVSNEEPLRLEHEIVQPGGGLHGSSYLNEDFKAYLLDLLASETYLEQGSETINGIVERVMIEQFEPKIKRNFDCYQRSTTKQLAITGLRDNPEKGFRRGCVVMSTTIIKEIFMKRLHSIFEIVKRQLDEALSNGCEVELLLPKDRNTIANAVSLGAVLRAMNKNHGPERRARSSYGILRAEPFKEYPEHQGMNPSYDRHDGLPYIKKTIDWVLKLGAMVPSVWNCEPFTCSHTFDVWPPRPLICKEILYVSDHSTRSHYRLSHPNNEGAQEVGEIVVDFSDLLEKGLTPVEPIVLCNFVPKHLNMSSSGDDGVDPVDLASNIGTWVAAGVAIIALVGVVGPYLALQASMSDKNRAMNAVQDQQQKYISRGWRLTRGLRVFRRIRVPNLAPGYITNEPDTAPLIPPLSAALGRWGFKTRDYLPWNTGWAKISELIESYEVGDGVSNRQVDLDVPKAGGTLEVVNSRTALVVNKHWILILGLLGRYGDRVDKGILQRKGIRRNFDGERASIRHFALPRKAKQRESDFPFEWVRKKQTHSMSRRRGSSSRDSASSRSWSDSEPDSDGTVMAVRRSAYGTITLETTPQPTIYGITGKLQQLGRHKGSWSYLTSVSFVPHIAKEIFEAGPNERREGTSLQTLFWLAHGFLPCGRTAEGRQMVISLEAPDLSLASIGRNFDDILAWPAYSLQESDDIPISIGIAMQCLGIPEPQILQFLPIDAASQAKRVLEKTRHHPGDETGSPEYDTNEDRRWERELPAQPAGLSIDGLWVRYSNPSQENFCLFRGRDFEKTLRLLLTIDWDNWGFLIWKDKFWNSILRRTTSILKINEICDSEFGQAFGLASHSRIFDWKQSGKFYPQRLADQLSFDKFLTDYLDTYDLRLLRLSLGVL